MKKLLAAAALGAVTASLVATPAVTASPPYPGPTGGACELIAVADPSPESDGNDMLGVIVAGPATTSEVGTMVCTVQAGASTHDGPDAAVREFASDSNGLIVGVQTVSYSTTEDDPEYICTSFRKADGTAVYWTIGPSGQGEWRGTPNYSCPTTTKAAGTRGTS